MPVKIVTSSPLFQMMANLEDSGSRISGSWSLKLTFSLKVTFYHAKLTAKLTDL